MTHITWVVFIASMENMNMNRCTATCNEWLHVLKPVTYVAPSCVICIFTFQAAMRQKCPLESNTGQDWIASAATAGVHTHTHSNTITISSCMQQQAQWCAWNLMYIVAVVGKLQQLLHYVNWCNWHLIVMNPICMHHLPVRYMHDYKLQETHTMHNIIILYYIVACTVAVSYRGTAL